MSAKLLVLSALVGMVLPVSPSLAQQTSYYVCAAENYGDCDSWREKYKQTIWVNCDEVTVDGKNMNKVQKLGHDKCNNAYDIVSKSDVSGGKCGVALYLVVCEP